jgi:hypothetical protein
MSYYNPANGAQGPAPSEYCNCGQLEAGPNVSGPNAKNPNEVYYSCALDKAQRGSGCKHFRFLRAELNSKRGGFGGGRGRGGGGGRGGGSFGSTSGRPSYGSAPAPSPSNNNYAQYATAPAPTQVPPFPAKRAREEEEQQPAANLSVLESHIIDLLNNVLELQKAVCRLETKQHEIQEDMAEISNVMVTLVAQNKNVEQMDQ